MRKAQAKLFKLYAKIFIYFLLITILFSFSTIVLHELGHFIFGLYYGCKPVRIVLFDTSIMTTYTEMECPPNVNMFLLGISGFFVVLPLSLIYFLISRGGERYLALIMIGFNLVIAVNDFEVYLKLPFSEIFAIFGSLLIVVGEILLIEKTIF
jgi:hypothetical protein